MSAANDLIERVEMETGVRVDDNYDNSALAGLFGALSRMMGQSPASYRKCDDFAAGNTILYQMSPEYKRKQESHKMLGELLAGGVSPDAVNGLLG